MQELIHNWCRSLRVPLQPDEFEAKRLLSAMGIPIPESQRLMPDTAPPVPEFSGPFVVKTCSPEILHKTEADGVQLDVPSHDFASVISDFSIRFPGKAVLVESQINYQGPEMIVGGLNDPAFGPALMVGAGGIFTEIFQDVVFRLAPLNTAESRCMIQELNIFPALNGFRNQPSFVDPLSHLLTQVSRLVADFGDILDQLDINPLVCQNGQWIALDVKILLHP
ncbi:acetate--CoA ligase family protein [Desulfobacterales bacterium HSG17]|nr:acetate--CoA ligase family protein [Desulfobacterales bacterium HSG17]